MGTGEDTGGYEPPYSHSHFFMSDRKTLHTQITPFEDRLKIWQESVTACQHQIELALAFQKTGKRIIEKFQSIKDDITIDPESLVKQYQQCLAAIDKGIKMEREARKELFDLQHYQPKDR